MDPSLNNLLAGLLAIWGFLAPEQGLAAGLLGQSFCWDTQGKRQYLKFLSTAYLVVLSFTASHHWKTVGRLGRLLSFAQFCTLVCKDKSHQGPLLLGQFLGTPPKCYYSSLRVMTPHQPNTWACLISCPTSMKQKSWLASSHTRLSKLCSFPSFFSSLFRRQYFTCKSTASDRQTCVCVCAHVCVCYSLIIIQIAFLFEDQT